MLTLSAALASLLAGDIVLAAFVPELRHQPKVLGVVADLGLNRDSCGSAIFGSRALWTCRDTQRLEPNGTLNVSVVSSSASWTNFTSDGCPAIESGSMGEESGILLMYGGPNEEPFFPYGHHECGKNSAGACKDGTRYALWPDNPPMVASSSDHHITAYTWIKQSHITGLTSLVDDPAVTLYKAHYTLDESLNSLPAVKLIKMDFWKLDEIDYGVYGNMVCDGVSYLYSQTSNRHVALARVPADRVEHKGSYEYWANGSWTAQLPGINCTSINIPNATAGGQGTFYYSDPWKSFVWIGQADDSASADFFITTAPEPQGPWAGPTHFYSGVNGNSSLPAYSLQAHPGLVKEGENAIYLTYTKNDNVTGNAIYTTPLIYAEWKDI